MKVKEIRKINRQVQDTVERIKTFIASKDDYSNHLQKTGIFHTCKKDSGIYELNVSDVMKVFMDGKFSGQIKIWK